jgi:hypothetical protein
VGDKWKETEYPISNTEFPMSKAIGKGRIERTWGSSGYPMKPISNETNVFRGK